MAAQRKVSKLEKEEVGYRRDAANLSLVSLGHSFCLAFYCIWPHSTKVRRSRWCLMGQHQWLLLRLLPVALVPGMGAMVGAAVGFEAHNIQDEVTVRMQLHGRGQKIYGQMV